MRVISADCHINEPPHVFDNVPAKLKDRAPKMMTGVDGGEYWSYDGKPPKRTFGIEATAGQTTAVKKISGLRFDEIMPGNYDGKAHAADMDKDGIDVSIVYPSASIFTYITDDRELGIACLNESALGPGVAPLAAPHGLPALPKVAFHVLPPRQGEDAFVGRVREELAALLAA